MRRTPAFVVAAVAAGLGLGAFALSSDAASGQPRELGTVRWGTDFSAAQKASEASGRPLFALFQEVPGCSTCVSFGESVLSHPLLVDAIEHEFVPVAIRNNDEANRPLLERFGEPAWNNPVVRFFDAQGSDLIPRKDGVWSKGKISLRMAEALEAGGREVPPYLLIAAQELNPAALQRATLGMGCFWRGEACLGVAPGIVATRADWFDGHEVVTVWFDERRVSYEALLAGARERGCASRVVAHTESQYQVARRIFGADAELDTAEGRPAPVSDQKRHLRLSKYAPLDLTPLQQVRVNAALARGDDPLEFLSPRQRAQLDPT